MKYFIQANSTIMQLEINVNNKIKLDGFKPIGSVTIQVNSSGNYWFYQAMVKEIKE